MRSHLIVGLRFINPITWSIMHFLTAESVSAVVVRILHQRILFPRHFFQIGVDQLLAREIRDSIADSLSRRQRILRSLLADLRPYDIRSQSMRVLVLVSLALEQDDLVVGGVHDVAEHAVLDVQDAAVGDTVDLTGLQRALLFIELPADPVSDFFKLRIDEV